MSKYTAEQVIEMATNVRDCAWPADVKEYMVMIEPMLRAYATTLRQQAGRVDEDVRDLIEDWRAAANAHDELSYACCGEVGRRCADELEAALAQNTQGEAVAWAELCEGPNGHRYWTHSGYTNDLPLGRYYLHAERARVPVGIAAAIAHIQQKADAYAEEHCGVEWDTGATTYHEGQAGEEYHHGLLELVDELQAIAAAPSQRAEVK